MEYKKVIGKNKNLPNWRIRVSVDRQDGIIECTIENFEYGFHSGEEFEEIFIYPRRHGSGLGAAYITKDFSTITNEIEDSLLTSVYNLLLDEIKDIKESINSLQNDLTNTENLKNAPIFRNNKIKTFLNA